MNNYIDEGEKEATGNIEEPVNNSLDSLNSSLEDDPFFNESPKKSTKLILKVIAGVVGLVLISGGVVLGARLWDPVWNPFRPSPEKVLTRSADKMNEVKSLEMKMTIDAGGEDGGFSAVVTSQTEGDTDDYKSKSDFKVVIEEGITKVSISGEFVGDENGSFIKLNKLPDASLIEMDFSFLTGTWIKSENQKSDLNEEAIEKLTNSIKENDLLIVRKELPNEKIGKTKVYHYILGFDEVALKNIIREIFNNVVASSGLLPDGMVADTIPESELDDMVKTIGDIEMDALIGIKDNLFYKIGVAKEATDDFGEKSFFNLVIEFSKFNEPVQIEIPNSYKTMEEIMSAFMFGPSILEDSGSPFDKMRRKAGDLLPVLNLR